MQKTIFLLLSFSIVLSLSNPIALRDHILNVGDVIAVFDADEPDQPAVLFAVQQAPLDESIALRSLSPEESKNEDEMEKKDCEGCEGDIEVQERSFLFKKLLLSKFIRPIAVPAAVPAPPRPVAVPSAFLIGTVYQPTSFVAAPIKATGSLAGLSSSSQAAMALALPATRPLIRPSVELAGASFLGTGLAGQQLSMVTAPIDALAAQGIKPASGQGNIGINIQQGGMALPSNVPIPNSVANINISSAELPEIEAAELAETTGATSPCSKCITSPCSKC